MVRTSRVFFSGSRTLVQNGVFSWSASLVAWKYIISGLAEQLSAGGQIVSLFDAVSPVIFDQGRYADLESLLEQYGQGLSDRQRRNYLVRVDQNADVVAGL